MNMTGNTILITGGTSGIGLALATAFIAEGNKVIIAGRRKALLNAAAAAHPGMATYVLDMQDASDITRVSAQIIQDHPDLNVVINNAGIMLAENLTAPEQALADAEAMITTNLIGPIRLTTALTAHLLGKPQAAIINVTSGLAFVPLAMTPTYSATKAALHSYTQSLRHQLRATSIKVLELAPPAVQTDLMPGQGTNPNSMPLNAYISEVMDLLKSPTDSNEILVQRVLFLRNAEASGQAAQVFGMLNGGH